MGLTRARVAVGVALVGTAGWLVGVDVAAVAAGGTAALAVRTAGRGTTGLAAASLGLAVAGVLLGTAVAAAPTIPFVVTTLAVAVGVGAGVRAAVDGGEGAGVRRGESGGLVAAWSAVALALTGVLTTLAGRPDPVVSLIGARLAVAAVGWLLLVVPLAVTAVAGALALDRWRTADLPPWHATAGPPVAVLAIGLLAGPGLPDVAALAGATPVAGLAVLLWGAGAAAVASAIAAGAASVDQRFRRPAAWLAAAAGPVALLPVVALEGGVFVAALVVIPGVAGPVGAALETGQPAVVTALVGTAFLGVVGGCAAAPTLVPRVREALDERVAEVAGAALLFAVATKPPRPHSTAVAGGVAVAGWLLVADRPRIAPPPRTELARTGRTTVAVAAGTVFAARYFRLVPRPQPGIGGLLLLAGVTLIGVAIAR